jgi:hypothetical protein
VRRLSSNPSSEVDPSTAHPELPTVPIPETLEASSEHSRARIARARPSAFRSGAVGRKILQITLIVTWFDGIDRVAEIL